MSGLSKSFAVLNWAASVVCLLMIILYLQRAECAGPDPDAAYIAVAWGVILGVTLSSAVKQIRQGRRLWRRTENEP